MQATAMLTILLATLVTIQCHVVSAETYYIVPEDNATCPCSEITPANKTLFPVTPTDHTPKVENTTCLTLSQFTQCWSESISPVTSITLIFVPGHHTLDSHLQIQNVTNLVLQIAQTNSSFVSVAMVACTNSVSFNFEDISEVSISGIVFIECRENSVRSVDKLRIEDCRFQNGNGMELKNVRNATFKKSSFIFLTAFREVRHPIYTWRFDKVGGGVVSFGSDVLVTDCLFELNRADGYGGAIWADNGSIIIHGSDVSRNTARNGGAIETVSGSIYIHGSNFSRNFAALDGGAVRTSSGSIGIFGSNFSSNTADLNGGGAIDTNSGSIIIHGSNFSKNSASLYGGAIDTNSGSITIHGSNFSRNSAGLYGGAISIGTGIGSISIHSSNFSNNRAGSGGAVWTFSGSITMYGSGFSSNTAGRDGGALQTSSGNISINGCDFSRNTAAVIGGAIRTHSGIINIHAGSSFSSNTAGVDGGVIQTVSGSISVHSSNFSSNTAGNNGGAIWADSAHISIHGSNFSRNTAVHGGGAIWTFSGSISILKFNGKSYFISNTAGTDGGVLFLDRAGGSGNINNSIFSNNSAANRGAAIFVRSRTLNFNGYIQITNSSATTGLVFALQSTLLLSGTTIISDNKASFYALASNITFDGFTDFRNNSHIHDTSVEEGGAITACQSDIVFTGTANLMNNAINFYGGAILAYESKIYTTGNTTIAYNTALSGGGIYAYKSELNFESRTNIEVNVGAMNGGEIYAVGSAIKLTEGQLEFTMNRAENGGGIYLELNAKLYVMKSVPECSNVHHNPYCIKQSISSLRLYFTNNMAKYGGALYISDDTNDTNTQCTANTDKAESNQCFFQDLASHNVSYPDLIVLNTFFDGNSASVSGGTIFGGLLDRCTVNPNAQVFNKYRNTYLDAITYLSQVTNLQGNNIQSEISSEPVRVCFCTNNEPDCDSPPKTFRFKVTTQVTFSISLATVDQVRNPVPSPVRALSSNPGGLVEGQDIQNTLSKCSDLNFTMSFPRNLEQLVLRVENQEFDFGIARSQIVANTLFLPCTCPIGFRVQQSCICECDPCLYPNYVTDCSPANSSVQRRDNIWLSYINKTVDDDIIADYRNECPFLTHPHCPFDYCHPSSSPVWINLNTPTGSDVQCAFNRTGILCGSCEGGLSLSLGSSHCMPCSSNWLVLLIVFAIAGVALVAFLLVFNLTVAVGTINGLIFYGNILTTSRATFFPFQTPNFFTIFIAWLNLDFGFVTCFFDGMDGYIKEWLQLAFPIYIIFMVTMVIIACEYTTRIARLFTHTNPVATLATLILLSFAKSLRVIIAALSYATLDYPDGSRDRVWLIDANIQYFKGKHFLLFVVALLILLVGIVYTSLLFSYQWLLRCPNRRALKWIKNARFYPFMDAYLAPYNLKHRYWTGLLLLIRAFLYVVAALNVSGDPGNNLLSIICTLLCLLLLKVILPSRVYKSWPLDVLETSFVLNVIMFSVGSLYIREAGVGNQDSLAYTSTSIALITFLAILIYHTYAFILPKTARNRLGSFKFKPSCLFTKKENTDPEIILFPNNAITYSVVDGIPPDPRLAMEKNVAAQHENETASSKTDQSNPSDFSVPSKQPTKEDTTPNSEEIAAKPCEKVIVDETGMDNKIRQQKGTANIELEPRPLTFADIRLDPYIRDSDELGAERETEIQDFLETAQ